MSLDLLSCWFFFPLGWSTGRLGNLLGIWCTVAPSHHPCGNGKSTEIVVGRSSTISMVDFPAKELVTPRSLSWLWFPGSPQQVTQGALLRPDPSPWRGIATTASSSFAKARRAEHVNSTSQWRFWWWVKALWIFTMKERYFFRSLCPLGQLMIFTANLKLRFFIFFFKSLPLLVVVHVGSSKTRDWVIQCRDDSMTGKTPSDRYVASPEDKWSKINPYYPWICWTIGLVKNQKSTTWRIDMEYIEYGWFFWGPITQSRMMIVDQKYQVLQPQFELFLCLVRPHQATN